MSVHDMPPKWDGIKVVWKPWKTIVSSLGFHLPVEDMTCDKCGSIDWQASCRGVVQTEPPQTLLAFGCHHCNQDMVYDLSTGFLWDLDPSDYSDEGSYELGQGALL